MRCTVIRDGKERELEARDLVPGDIIILEEGDSIAADARVRRVFSLFKVATNELGRSSVTTKTKTAPRLASIWNNKTRIFGFLILL